MKPLLISSGEPAGVGPDLCLALAEYDSPLVILGDQAVLEARAKELGRPICFTPYQSGQVVVPQSGHLSVLSVNCHLAVQSGCLNSIRRPYYVSVVSSLP